jgi:hypothetical protein
MVVVNSQLSSAQLKLSLVDLSAQHTTYKTKVNPDPLPYRAPRRGGPASLY